ncbi:MAG: cell division protein FtsA [Candidatus Omnitrophota bacterium]|nr:MAG: cell division protein FtsA [Candidatus Omnitrophota bacterium]
MLNNYICALDISSSKIAAVVCEIKRKRIVNIFFEYLPARNILRRGSILNSVELTAVISKVLKNLKNKSKLKIKSVCINISGQGIVTKHSHAIIPLAERGSRIITNFDIKEVNEQARILGSNLEEEIIHQVPSVYTVDSGTSVLNPIGLYSHKLEADLYLICARLSSIQTLAHIVAQAGYEIKDLFFSGYTTSRLLFNEEQDSRINIICDIGSDVTELIVFRNKRLSEIKIVPAGGDDLTESLSRDFKISFELAQEIKESYAIAGNYNHMGEEEVLIKKDHFYKPLNRKRISEIVSSRALEICQMIKESLKEELGRDGFGEFIVVGRSIMLEGFLELLEQDLGVPVKAGRVKDNELLHLLNKNSLLSRQKYLTYLTALGMLEEALRIKDSQGIFSIGLSENPFHKIMAKAKEIYQEYF